MKDRYDAIVIGAGHNGLVAAASLAKAGRRVVVLEKRGHLGGAAATEERFAGYHANIGAPDAALFRPEIIKELDLESHGLAFIDSPALLHALAADGAGLTIWRDVEKTAAGIARLSLADAKAYPAFSKKIAGLAGVLKGMLMRPPPTLPDYRFGELLSWAGVALQARRLGDRTMVELLRVLAMPAGDFLDEHFEHPLLKAALAMVALRGTMLGPFQGGTALMLLYQALGEPKGAVTSFRPVVGGSGMLSEALAKAAVSFGAEIRTHAAVKRLLIEDEAAVGVHLAGGEDIRAGMVLSSADPRTTFFQLAGPASLAPEFVHSVKNIRYRGSTARVLIGLSGMPDFQGTGKTELGGRILTAQHMEQIEKAYDDAKYGRISKDPVLEIMVPSLQDDSLAPAGRHILTVDYRFAPYRLAESSRDMARQTLQDRTMDVLDRFAPGLRDLARHVEVIMPWDYEERYGLPEGSIFHGQMGLDQLLMMRPVGGYARYRTPIRGLYLCGAGSHPGGGVTGAPGYLAARQALKGGRNG